MLDFLKLQRRETDIDGWVALKFSRPLTVARRLTSDVIDAYGAPDDPAPVKFRLWREAKQ